VKSIPLGSFSYEVLGLQSRVNYTLRADKPFDVEVYDSFVGPIKTTPRPR
jgi:hypothetical protein